MTHISSKNIEELGMNFSSNRKPQQYTHSRRYTEPSPLLILYDADWRVAAIAAVAAAGTIFGGAHQDCICMYIGIRANSP